MANYSTLEHSKTLGKTQIPNFSTLAGTLDPMRPYNSVPSASAQQRSVVQIPSHKTYKDRYGLLRGADPQRPG